MDGEFTATYSPDDNKLRLYALHRLDRDLYERVKAAGFRWAPKQELFVAPAWTPQREDLLIELAGEIEDEDKSLAERAEERAERFDGYHESRLRDAHAAEAGVKAISEHIPLGQPILVGHHSEKRARKDAERIEAGLRRAVTMWDRAEYWTDRAAGALRHAKYKQLPPVRHRRIKDLEADKRKQEKDVFEAQVRIGEWEHVAGHEDALKAANVGGYLSFRVPLDKYPRGPEASQYEGPTSLWSALTEGVIGWEKARELALRAYNRQIEWAERWIGHYENRLAYERAMLQEAGGLKADAFDIQPGGQVLTHGEWLTVKRVNRKDGEAVSVSTMARDFRRVVGIETIKDYRPPTEESAEKVKAATKLPPLVNFRCPADERAPLREMTKAQWKRYTDRTDSAHTRVIAATEEHGAYRQRYLFGEGCRLYPVFLVDEKEKTPPAASQEPKPTFAPERAEPRPVYQAREKNRGDELREALRAGVQVAVADQLFPTPMDVAQRMVILANVEPGHTILEPSAGTGNLLRAARAWTNGLHITAVEINGSLAERIKPEEADCVFHTDFLLLEPEDEDGGDYDVILMNPPFAGADDIRHIRHAMRFLKPGGRLVAICAGGPRQERELKPLATHWEHLPEGTFKESGTSVSTVLLVIDAPEGP